MKRHSGRKMTVIDAHSHVNWIGIDAKQLVANMDEFGIDKTWLLTWECPAHEIDMVSYPSSFAPTRACFLLTSVMHSTELSGETLASSKVSACSWSPLGSST